MEFIRHEVVGFQADALVIRCARSADLPDHLASTGCCNACGEDVRAPSLSPEQRAHLHNNRLGVPVWGCTRCCEQVNVLLKSLLTVRA